MFVQYVDDPAVVADEDELWRRLYPSWVIPDENAGGVRISSAAFDDSSDGSPLSVLLAKIVAQTGRSSANVLKDFPGYGLAALTAGAARKSGQGIMSTPTPDEPAHASVFGKKPKSVKKALARAARVIVGPRNDDLPNPC